MTKATVAALVGMEVSRGTLHWDTLVKDILPAFKSTDITVQENTTVTDLLSHRTGITNFDASWLQSQNTVLLDRSQILPFFATLRPALGFRSSFLYNNWGYEILALMLEQVTGVSLSELLEKRLFEPLGMHRTSTSWHTEDDNVAKSYGVLDDLTSVQITRPQLGKGTLMEAAGGVKSTIFDLIRIYKAWLRSINLQFRRSACDDPQSVLMECCTLISNDALLPGTSLREQGYAAGWARSQLPGQMGRVSQNVLIGEERPPRFGPA